MVKEIYCGVKDVPKGKRLGNMKECLEDGKVSHYGIKKIDPILLKSLNKKKGKKIRSAIKIWMDIVKVKALIKRLKQIDKPREKDEDKLKEIEKNIKLNEEKLNLLKEEYKLSKDMEEEKEKEKDPKYRKAKKLKEKKIKEEVKEEIKEDIKEELKEEKKENKKEELKEEKKENKSNKNLKQKIKEILKRNTQNEKLEKIKEQKTKEEYNKLIKDYDEIDKKYKKRIIEKFEHDINQMDKKQLQLLKTKLVNKMEEYEEKNKLDKAKEIELAYDKVEERLKNLDDPIKQLLEVDEEKLKKLLNDMTVPELRKLGKEVNNEARFRTKDEKTSKKLFDVLKIIERIRIKKVNEN
jgi:hypothetical protein